MSIEAFQRALCDLIASPCLTLNLRSDPGLVLGRYELTARERRRLLAVVRQRGMSTNCSLYRVNRITPLYTLLPFTCSVLGEDLRKEAELFWESFPDTDLQFKREINHFAVFLRRRVQTGLVTNPFLEEVLRFELATNALRFLPRREIARGLCQAEGINRDSSLELHPLIRVVRFQHEPTMLLSHLAQMLAPPFNLPSGKFFLLLDAMGEDLVVKRIDARLGQLLQEIELGSAPSLSPDDAEALVQARLVVPNQRPNRSVAQKGARHGNS